MGLFDKPEYKNLADIADGTPFVLFQAATREVDTKFGRRTAFDLRISLTGNDDDAEWYSGFSAGVVRQVEFSRSADFPTWAKIQTTDAKGGRQGTRFLAPIEDEPTVDDDIPF